MNINFMMMHIKHKNDKFLSRSNYYLIIRYYYLVLIISIDVDIYYS